MNAPTNAQALMLCLVLALCGCGTAGDDGVDGDGAVEDALDEPSAVFPEDFGAIRTVRELADGTVLVADPLGNALYRVDLEAGTRTQIGSEGQGPGEYRQPDAAWPLPADSTLLVDLGNGRLTTLGPALEFGPTSPLSAGDPRTGIVIALPEGVDAEGRIYTESRGGPGAELPDSAAVLRIERGSLTGDSAAMVKLSERVRSESGDAGERSVSIRPVPLSSEDAWGVAPDGSVVVARSPDYRVEWHHPDGSVVSGAPVPWDPVPLGTAEKEAWLAARGRSGGGLQIQMAMENGVMRMAFGRGGSGSSRREIDDYVWPETGPPFYADRIMVDPLGRAWVRRYVEPDVETTYDVFDRSGNRVATHTLADDRVVVGFGEDAVYVVAYDDLDLSYLERYALPG